MSTSRPAPPASSDPVVGLAEAEAIAPFGVWEWDITHNTVRWSEGLYRIYGLNRGEFPATYEGYIARVHPEDRARVHNAVQQASKEVATRYDFRDTKTEIERSAEGIQLNSSDQGRLEAALIEGLDWTLVRLQIDRLRHLLRQLQRAQFGRRSEKLDPEQLQLGLEDIEQAMPTKPRTTGDTARPLVPAANSAAPTAARCRGICRAWM